ncbi:cyclic nucleotide-binding domain-containing protein [Persicimonas caeni]|uniref:Cyclic nucleotide-binding domain-containing protein n=1 Tax=Persicimonas caeni TaxID=2292766 RepID=A0A4Y6PLR9_PERCE|nr:cyclic nucleotide-binding domain-containing protein [Persicimonas caeni]QDG49228.1 cyclic nucleotide-binding domain-containing protein [Persicimonas caeni]QED30449.1 cyclic nucleotide-binding domain-containing protein [Persicimonas caeni]
MELTKLVSLLSKVDDAIEESEHAKALALVLHNFSKFEDNALLRERVAILLASNGRKKEAVGVWDHVARHWANSGHPTRSLAAIKQMHALRPDITMLLDHFTALYNIRSPYLDQDARLPEVAPPTEEVELHVALSGTSLKEMLDEAFAVSIDTDTLVNEPQSLPPLPLLSLLPSEALRRVLDFLEYEIFADAEAVLTKDEMAGDLIWTVTADFTIEDHDPSLRLPSGALLGLSSFGRSATTVARDVYSRKNSELLRLTRESIDALDEELGDFRNRLSTLRRHALTEGLLERHPMFAELDDTDRVELMRRFVGLRVSQGEKLIEQDGQSPGIFVVLDGEVDILRSEEGWEITIATLSAGDVFGEVGVVSDRDALAGCKMTTPGHLLFLSREEFGSVADQYPAVAKYAVNLANERMEDVETTLSAQDLAEVE